MAMNPRLLRPTPTGFDPRRIASLANWWDASDSATVTLNGTTVQSWSNKSSGPALAQGTAGAQPTYTTAGVNGRNVLTFDGGDVMTATQSYSTATGTVFAVVRENSAVSSSGIISFHPATGSEQDSTNSLFYEFSNDANLVRIARGTQIRALAGAGLLPLSVLASVAESTNLALRVDGSVVSTSSVSATTGTSTGILVGGRFQGGAVSNSFRANMTLCEILHYTAILSNSEISAVERYLGRKWGVAVA
jgi:hypothetical protein